MKSAGFCMLILVVALSWIGGGTRQENKVGETAAVRSKIMSCKDYSKLSHPLPYVVRLAAGEGELLYFGSRHTYDPSDPQVSEIEKLWKDFRPTIAFNEARSNPPALKTSEEALARQGEPGLVRFLAGRDSVPVHGLEPRIADEAALLLPEFSAEQIKVFYVLRDIPQFWKWRRPEQSVDEYVRNALGGLSKVPGLEGPALTLAEFEKSSARLLPKLEDWRKVPQAWFDPACGEPLTYTNVISRRLADFRDEHMVELLVNHMRRGERVFAVVGASHVVMQEPALRSALKTAE